MWQAQISALPHTKPEEAAKILGRIARMSAPRLEKVKSVYEQCGTPQERMRLIGSALGVGGSEWLRSHPQQAAWMAENEISVSDCLREFEAYYAEKSNFAGFRPAKKKNRAMASVVE